MDEKMDLIEYAWSIIANAGGGDWTNETDDWQIGAKKWRAQYFDLLSRNPIYTDENVDEH